MTQAPNAPRAERADSAANRERILAAARQAFASRGLDAEVKEIAALAGVGVGTLYRHFESRDELLRAVITRTRVDLLGRIETALETTAPAEAFRAVIRAAAEVFERFGALTELAISGRLPEYHPEHHEEFNAAFARLLQRGIGDGSFRPDLDIETTIAALAGVFVSGQLAQLGAARGFEAAADAVADLFLSACLARR